MFLKCFYSTLTRWKTLDEYNNINILKMVSLGNRIYIQFILLSVRFSNLQPLESWSCESRKYDLIYKIRDQKYKGHI